MRLIQLYYINPLTYLFGGMLLAADGDVNVVCDAADLLSFPPPQGQTCGSYAGQWAASVQANLTNPSATDLCLVCQYTKGTQYLAQFGLQDGRLANNMWAYLAVFLLHAVQRPVLLLVHVDDAHQEVETILLLLTSLYDRVRWVFSTLTLMSTR